MWLVCSVRNAIDESTFLIPFYSIILRNLPMISVITSIALHRCTIIVWPFIIGYRELGISITWSGHTYVLLIVGLCCAQCNRRIDFFDTRLQSSFSVICHLFRSSQALHCIDVVMMYDYQLLAIESWVYQSHDLVIHTYSSFLSFTVRNAIDESTFLRPVTASKIDHFWLDRRSWRLGELHPECSKH